MTALDGRRARDVLAEVDAAGYRKPDPADPDYAAPRDALRAAPARR